MNTNLSAGSAKVIDATGKHITAGLIDEHSHIAGTGGINEGAQSVSSEVRIADIINSEDVNIYRQLAGGVTTSQILHGSANPIGGQSQLIKLRWGKSPEELKFAGADGFIKFALGENPTRVHGRGNGIQPRTRMGVEAVLRNGFSEAIQYKKAWETYNAAKATKGNTLTPPTYSERLQTLADILDGKIIIHCHSYRADEIYMLINVAKDFNIKKLVFQHTNEGFKVAPEIAEYTMGASVFADWWAYKMEVYYSTAYNAAILQRNGAITSINSDSAELIRHLYHEAAKTQRYGGLTDEEALAMITINPAKQLGIDDKVGSLEVGKQADIVIFDTHPLSSYAVPQMTFVDGMKYFDIKSDKDDQRQLVAATEMVEPIFLRANEEAHRCMQDVDAYFEAFQGAFFHEKH